VKPTQNINQIEDSFFRDLKKYNSSNFKGLAKADLSKDSASIHKAFSSVVTRYFIFREKHADEFTEVEFNMLYFKLKIDLISKYFSEYPSASVESLVAFQLELNSFIERSKKEENNHERDEQTTV
jgi:uncharacterized protein with von Willebrand factor type A (vWA) domain